MLNTLQSYPRLKVKQAFEWAELLNFETRNKYRISDDQGRDVAFAAEQQRGFLGFLFRQTLGHWRTFDIHFFDSQRKEFLFAHHPFRWFFQRLEVCEVGGRPLGYVERRWAIFTKRFDVRDASGRLLMEVSSPFWKMWTFPFFHQGRERARILKKWSGIGYELFTDKDNFLIEYLDPTLSSDECGLILAASIYIDLMFFERKGSGGILDIIGDS